MVLHFYQKKGFYEKIIKTHLQENHSNGESDTENLKQCVCQIS
jgi:hypothetical protein